ncbi:uncharacterized protein LOC115354228 [Myripristis murdjan]|uniref:Uncharacterized LOC115354228 n=1 Tax=Myripristis murdjan TaxID=586833 RepID=A0A667Y311_9TELE|nr:uncharacterized protein LOC115354228 [Myripristis murdjan]
MPAGERRLPDELWLQVFCFLSVRDKLSVRATCRHFLQLLDGCCGLWRDFCVVLSHFSAYNRPFWRSLARRRVDSVVLRRARRKHLKQLALWLPDVGGITIDGWSEAGADELRRFARLRRLAVSGCVRPLRVLDFLLPLSQQLTQLSVCNVRLACSAADFVVAASTMTRLTSLLFHHDGSQSVPLAAFHALLRLPDLQHLSWEMITYKTLPQDFFSPAPPAGGALRLSSLQLLNYDTVVSQEVLRPLSRLRSLSVYHLYSVPGPTCHLQTWLSALQQLSSLSVHGGHPLGAYADFLPASVRSLMLCVDMTAADLRALGMKLPELQCLHLEPWGDGSLVGLVPQLFPRLRTLRIKHHNVPDDDFLCLARLQQLETLEVLDSYHQPDRVGDQPSPRLLRLVAELQSLTNHRVQVVTSRGGGDLPACPCV